MPASRLQGGSAFPDPDRFGRTDIPRSTSELGQPRPIAKPFDGKLGLPESELKTASASIQSQVPAGRFGEPAEIANAILFLASRETAFAVGSDLILDGGMNTL